MLCIYFLFIPWRLTAVYIINITWRSVRKTGGNWILHVTSEAKLVTWRVSYDKHPTSSELPLCTDEPHRSLSVHLNTSSYQRRGVKTQSHFFHPHIFIITPQICFNLIETQQVMFLHIQVCSKADSSSKLRYIVLIKCFLLPTMLWCFAEWLDWIQWQGSSSVNIGSQIRFMFMNKCTQKMCLIYLLFCRSVVSWYKSLFSSCCRGLQGDAFNYWHI